jgi:hypothetical protein
VIRAVKYSNSKLSRKNCNGVVASVTMATLAYSTDRHMSMVPVTVVTKIDMTSSAKADSSKIRVTFLANLVILESCERTSKSPEFIFS